MPQELVPELHDIGKLLDNEAINAERSDIHIGSHHFVDDRQRDAAPLYLARLGLPQPNTATWVGILHHHRTSEVGLSESDNIMLKEKLKSSLQGVEFSALADLVCLILADHLAASTSRPVPESVRRVPSTSHRFCLWRDDVQQYSRQGPLISSVEELKELLVFLSSDPDAEAFYRRYGALLDKIPEEKGFPEGVTTLKTHCDLVGKFYRVLHSAIEHTPQGLRYNRDVRRTWGSIQQTWRFRLVECRVVIPTLPSPARTGDLGVFRRLEDAVEAIRTREALRDHLLLDTFQTLWLFLPMENVRSLADVIRPLLDAGFHVEATVREAPLTNLTKWKDFEHDARQDPCYLQPDLPGQVRPPLCEVCQLAPGFRQWQKGPEDVVEHLCGICYDTRQQYSERFVKLAQWQEGYAAWLRVFMDFGSVGKHHLHELFEKFVARVGEGKLSPEEQKQLVEDLRATALTVDYVNDFLAMQADLAENIRRLFSKDNVEELTSRRKELLVVRLEHRRDVLRLLHLCYTVALRHFPNSMSKPPFRFAVSLAPVRFPFGEHWRLLQQADSEVAVYLPGVGKLVCRLEVTPYIAQEQRSGFRRGVFRLADLATQSQALARVALQDREEHDLADVASSLSRLGMDFESMATFARLLRE